MTGDDVNLQVDDILADDELSLKILDVSGHYAFNDPEVKSRSRNLPQPRRSGHRRQSAL
ncbi:MAG: hypothetical protein ACLU7D_08080 [Collinsella sp.]